MEKRKYTVKKTKTGWRIQPCSQNEIIFGGEFSTKEEAGAEIENIKSCEADAREEAAAEDIHCFTIE